MKGFLNVLGGIVIVIGVVGGICLFFVLDLLDVDAALCFGIALGISLECLITAAILLAMAEGLRLLERIADGQTESGGMAAVRPCLEKGEERKGPIRPAPVSVIAPPRVRLEAGEEGRCPGCGASYRPGITICKGCGIALEGKGEERGR